MIVPTILAKALKNTIEIIFINHRLSLMLLLDKFMNNFAYTIEWYVYCLVTSENYVTPVLHNDYGH